ncbi:ubiquitin carboxyl-terminal hydrolase 16-like [Saccostrea cucullata]|uniref:ubiquitin carboxyl-terminal hydrolase 16-like n=1 Tax=Saccostrea cuccullata TaxID=36930 RepID=UPI002ED3532A
MRVLESGAAPSYNMGKNKKHKLRKTKEVSDSSDDALGVPRCNHINMAVNVAAMKKGLMKQVYGECASCTNETTRKTTTEGETGQEAEASPALDVEPTLWVCLQCGNQGCDRNSREKHALKHYETPRSSCHCLVINTTSWTTWCYKCDDEVPIEQSKRLQESIDIIRKQAGLPQTDIGRKPSQTGSSVGVIEQSSKSSTLTPRSSGVCSKVKVSKREICSYRFSLPNAAEINLTQTPCLESVVVDKSKKGRLCTLTCKRDSDLDSSSGSDDSDDEIIPDLAPIEISLPEAGPLTQTMIAFLQEMNNSSGRSSTVNPIPLFSQICKKAQRFRGFQQQDSHELLRYLLDNMRMEEIKRGQSGILKHFKLPENVNPKKVDDEMKIKIKEYGRQVKYTFVDSLFGGYLMSTVTCEECKNISQIFEPFLDLSLPVTEEKPQRPNQMLGGRKKDSLEHQEDTVIDHTDRPSKHMERKLKKQAKKEAKRKAKQTKNLLSPSDDPSLPKNEAEGDQEEVEKEEDGGSKDPEEESSSREDPSDADIEDNLESDTSRCFSKLSLENSLAEPSHSSQEKPEVDQVSIRGVDSGTSSSNTDTLTSGTSTSTLKQEDSSIGNEGGLASIASATQCSSSDHKTQDNGREPTFNGQTENPVFDSECVSHESALSNCQENGGLENDIECDNDIDSCCKLDSECNIGIPKINHIVSNGIGESDDCGRTTSESVEMQTGSNQVKDEVKVNGEPMHSHSRNSSTNSEVTAKLGNLILEDSSLVNSVEYHQGENGIVDLQTGGSNCEKIGVSTPPPHHSKSVKEIKREALVRSKVTLGSRYHPSSRECTIMTCLHQFTSAELLTGNNKFGCAKCTQTKYRHSQSLNKDKKEKVYSNAAKQYLIYTPPAVLTLHLKRFEQVGFSSRKVNRHVDFPFVLDLAPYCSSLCQGVRPGQKKILYALYGVVEHSGRLNAGHYTAYVKVRPNIGITGDFINSGAPSINDCIKRYPEQQNSTASLEEQEESLVDRLVPPGRWYHISDSRVSETTESTVQRAQAYLLFYERIY